MPRLHSTLIAFVLGAAAAVGLFAAVKTVQLGQTATAAAAPPAVSAHVIAVRKAKLAAWSRTLQHERAKHPPALPKLPKFAPIPVAPAAAPAPVAVSASPPAVAPARVRYVRPKPVVRYQHAPAKTATTTAASSATDDGQEDQTGSGDDGGSGGYGGDGGGD